jgi:hypothetical protein
LISLKPKTIVTCVLQKYLALSKAHRPQRCMKARARANLYNCSGDEITLDEVERITI